MIADEMTLSKEERIEDCNLALKLMLAQVGDEFLNLAECEIASPPFNDIKTTTWQELEQRYLIEDSSTLGHRRYILTGYGWRTALELNWDSYKTLVEERLTQLAIIFKKIVKDRQQDGYIFLDSAAAESGVPAGWICNAIDASLLEYKFNMKGAEWDNNGKGSMINIPVGFGLEPLDY
jgi:hypothetical protein